MLQSNCETNDDCDDNSCCVPMRRFYIMSKRDVRPKAKIGKQYAGYIVIIYIRFL